MKKRGRKKQDPILKKAIIEEKFNLVKQQMLLGYGKDMAYKKAGINKNWAIRNFDSLHQKTLDEIKYSFSPGYRRKI